ncbi:MAG: HEPN domain-containing protein [Flavobacterium sp.]|uniref:HEPN domain-containing protein n=1 Tax=Flavobacterium sp. TaxID=239 RepID=UPI002B46D93A|nr:HEPN domain-containing protein [Flavobacterium sp.]WRH74265.1 MAG: HEPN domain-containing protein [Flavobacterium sp.]
MVTKVFKNFEEKLHDLERTVKDCNDIIISDEPITFVYENANFLTKSFLISLCGYLETYLKDVLEVLIMDYNERIARENFPYNLIRWSIENKENSDSKVSSLLDKKKSRFESLSLKIKKKDLDSFISGNPFRTKELFSMFGINLDDVDYYNKNKDTVNQIVTKRNNVLHHNDDASDLSNLDILQYINEVKRYCNNLDQQIECLLTNKDHCI